MRERGGEEKRPGGGGNRLRGPFTRMACQGFHLLRTRPGTPYPLLMAKQAGTPDSLVVVAIIEAGWTQGPTFYIAKQRRFNDGPGHHAQVAKWPAFSSRAISCDEDSWRDLMPFTSDPGAYSPPPHICQSGICCYITHWPFLGERPWLRENECDGEDYQQCKEHLCSSVVIWHSRPLV